ncbi:protein phosphatase 2C domain-containing protein [Flammeovirga kamogawensis]|uniref:Protein phosphatase 2C domain-containing protein n=1 Tax=Flammeovirga kamogawensis TaxID=373891 RepID=A0ABX8H2N1_9BACT|nr:protein phosphatase 2C domain-containing protein [Flammeovirga kamogawensis]MBB6462189.1 hypothetical protein [Flammeovirga kamogawensis]QWG09410.1 protein phosphatase 2C domain-containing protein [Flammeovirga kamogawensis]TRX64928.1 hypothetical protein EO216_20560 [Flammeovirga kamogawensis]
MIQHVYKKGDIHSNHNEDAFYTYAINNKFTVMAVMDGCSTGVDSYFASALIKKLLKKICLELPQKKSLTDKLLIDDISLDALGKYITRTLFIQLIQIKNKLCLDYSELASTVLISVINTQTKKTWVMVSGDGMVNIDDEVIIIDQQNIPHFLCYFLESTFSNWFTNYTFHKEFSFHQKVILASDGVKSFKNKRLPTEKLLRTFLDKRTQQYFSESHKDDISIVCYSI